MSELDKKQKKADIVSLSDIRKRALQSHRLDVIGTESRLHELEADVLKLVDMVLIQHDEIQKLGDRLWKILRLMKQSTSDGAE